LTFLTNLRGCNQGKRWARSRDRSILRFPRSTLKLFDIIAARRRRVSIGRGFRYTKTVDRERRSAHIGKSTFRNTCGDVYPETKRWQGERRRVSYPPKRACHSQAAESISLYSRINDDIIFQRSRRDALHRVTSPETICSEYLLPITRSDNIS